MLFTHGNLYVIVTCPSYGRFARPRCSLLRSGRGGERGKGWGGPRHNGREETGGPVVTVRVSRKLKTSGQHKNTLPFVGRVLGHIQLYGEQDIGGGGEG